MLSKTGITHSPFRDFSLTYSIKKSVIEGVPKSMPSTLQALRITEKASRVGFDWPHYSDIINNTFTRSDSGCNVCGGIYIDSDGGGYYLNVKNNLITDCSRGIEGFLYSSNISNNIIKNNGFGINIIASDCLITNNIVTDNVVANIVLDGNGFESGNNTITYNTIHGAFYDQTIGLYLFETSGNIITHNDIRDNNRGGIYLERSTDNIITLINNYNIDDNASEHLYDGSIIQDDGDTIYDGIVNYGNAAVQIQIIQNGAVLSDDWWNYNGGGLNPDSTSGISHRFMLKVRTGGADIDNRKLIGTCRRFGYTYKEFKINATERGKNTLALEDSSDLNNQTAEGTVSGWTTITNTEGYASIDVNNDSTDEHYYSEWNRDTYTINQYYERMKWLTRDGSSSTIYGLSGELFRGITHEIAISSGSGTWVEPESLSWGSGATAGTGQLLAVDNTTASSSTKMWIQLLTGVVPNANTITGNGGATATAGTVTERTISVPFCGISTGSAIIGAYGLGIEVNDLTSNDKVKDLTNATITPPNYVTNTVAGLVSGEDRVLVAPWDGSSTDTNGDPAIDKDQLSLSTALTADNITSVVITTSIPSDTPSSGYIRVYDNDGLARRLHFSSWTGSTFTIDTTDGNEDFASTNASSGNDVFIAYIDELASGTTATFTSVQSGSRDLVVIVRDGGGTPIKQFISSWSQTSSAQTITAIRTTDA